MFFGSTLVIDSESVYPRHISENDQRETYMHNWEKRYYATSITNFSVAKHAPARGIVASNQSGVTQLYAWDVATNDLRQLTTEPSGKAAGMLDPSGKFVVYMQDDKGNERGQLVCMPWDGGEPQRMTPELATYGVTGMAIAKNGKRFGFIGYRPDGFRLYMSEVDAIGKLSNLRELWHDVRSTGGVNLSYDGTLVVIGNTQSTGTLRWDRLALDVDAASAAPGAVLATLHDNGASYQGWGFVPHPDSHDYVGTSDKSGFHRPYIWNPYTQAYREFELSDIQGDVRILDVSVPDDAPEDVSLLLINVDRAQVQMYRYCVSDNALHRLDHASGSYAQASFSAEGTLLALWEDAVQPRSLVRLDAQTGERTAVLLEAEAVPQGRPWRSISFESTDDATIQAWVAVPEGDGPFPTILHTHGGPTAVLVETFSAEAQAYLDHGFAWCSVNYRGSVTFGRDFERSIYGNLGVREVDDMVAARNWLVDNNIARPDLIFLTGRSYGGYLTLQAAGREPALWAGGMADVAIADWNLMYQDQAEGIRQYQASILGLPEDNPVNYAIASPITYAAAVRAPLLVIQGESDPRCPPRQLKVYEQRLRDLGKPIEVHWYDAGHASYDMALKADHQRLRLAFAQRVIDDLS